MEFVQRPTGMQLTFVMLVFLQLHPCVANDTSRTFPPVSDNDLNNNLIAHDASPPGWSSISRFIFDFLNHSSNAINTSPSHNTKHSLSEDNFRLLDVSSLGDENSTTAKVHTPTTNGPLATNGTPFTKVHTSSPTGSFPAVSESSTVEETTTNLTSSTAGIGLSSTATNETTATSTEITLGAISTVGTLNVTLNMTVTHGVTLDLNTQPVVKLSTVQGFENITLETNTQPGVRLSTLQNGTWNVTLTTNPHPVVIISTVKTPSNEVVLSTIASLNVTTRYCDRFVPSLVQFNVSYTSEWQTFNITIIRESNSTIQDHCPLNYSITVNDTKSPGSIPDYKSLPDNVTHLEVNGRNGVTPYHICIWATSILTAFKGNEACKTFKTTTGKPFPPSDVKVENVYSRNLTVTWKRPWPRAGPTTFHVTVIGMHTTHTARLHDNDTQIDFSTVITNLVPYTPYEISIYSETVADKSDKKLVGLFWTLSDAPGIIQNLAIELTGNNSKVVIRWDDPAEKNGELDYFSYTIHSIRSDGENPMEQGPNQTKNYSVTIPVFPDHNYTFTICGFNQNITEPGKPATKQFKVPSKIPPLPDKEPTIETPESNSETQVKVQFDPDLFASYRGKITHFAIVVSSISATTTERSGNLDSSVLKRWHDVKFEEFVSPYQTTPSNYAPFEKFNRIRNKSLYHDVIYFNSAPVTFVVGTGIDCASQSDFVGYCNGPLRPDTPYNVWLRAYTDAGYSDTKPVTFRTEGGGGDDAVVIIFTVLLSLIGVAAVGFFIKQHFWINNQFALPAWMAKYARRTSQLSLFNDQTSLNSRHSSGVTSRPVKVTAFSEHYRTMAADSFIKFSMEFEELKSNSGQHPMISAMSAENRTKNRYVNILPFDHSRVKLRADDGDASSDYINASYIPGIERPRTYIACQGPLPSTVDDFWRMVWEQNSRIIVMVTQCVERGKVKCDQYWPTDKSTTYYGDMGVTLKSESILTHHTVRIFDIQVGDRVEEVWQFHFNRWPDFGCPEDTACLLAFMRTVRELTPRKLQANMGPIVIHCSAGVGRTGTFIALDKLLTLLRREDVVDVYGTVLDMRSHRCNMVQTEDQYEFIHKCLRDVILNNEPIGNRDYAPDDCPIYQNILDCKETETEV